MIFMFEALYLLKLCPIFGMFKEIQVNLDEQIIGVEFISWHVEGHRSKNLII